MELRFFRKGSSNIERIFYVLGMLLILSGFYIRRLPDHQEYLGFRLEDLASGSALLCFLAVVFFKLTK